MNLTPIHHQLCYFTRTKWEAPDSKDASNLVILYGSADGPYS